MKPGWAQTAFMTVVAAVFSLGLTFASVELPRLLDNAIQHHMEHPSVDSHGSPEQRFRTELFIKHYHLRTIGYACFATVILLIILGFATRRHGLASLGAVAIFLPVFGQFALTMFYLAGLGLLNLTWLPMLDISLDIMRLGDVVNLPVYVLNALGRMLGTNLQTPFSLILMGTGLLLFMLGVLAWMQARFKGKSVADFWLYRFSRHPQYLGWIIWSYGFMICPLNRPNMKRAWGIDGSLAWLLATMIIIAVCLLEEIRMKRDHGTEYTIFQHKTPFLFPMPRWLRRLFSWPGRKLFGPTFPKCKRDVLTVVGLYTLVLVLLSYPAQQLRPGLQHQVAATRLAGQHTDAELVKLAAQSHARYRDRYFQAISMHTDTARDTFTKMLHHEHGGLREGGIRYLSRMPDPPEAEFIRLLDDPVSGVQWTAVAALGELACTAATEPIIRLLEQGDRHLTAPCVGALGNMKNPQARNALLQQMGHEDHWVRTVLAGTLANYPDPESRKAILALLGDEHEWVRRSAALALLKLEDPLTKDALQKALDDPDWEVRLYAGEALSRMGK